MEPTKVEYMRMALGICGLGVSDMTAEIIVRVYQGIEKMGGEFSLMDAAKIEAEVQEKYYSQQKLIPIKKLEDLYDDTVDQLHTRPEEDPLTPEMIIDAMAKVIETHKEDPT